MDKLFSYFLILLLSAGYFITAQRSHALEVSTSSFERIFTADSPEQHFVIGGGSLFRLNIQDGWRSQIMLTHRGVEYYGGPRWAVVYEYSGIQKLLAFSKEGDATLTVHPKYIINSLSDNILTVTHKIEPWGFSLLDTVTLVNKSNSPVHLNHHQIWDLYMHRPTTPYLSTLIHPIPGLEETHSYLNRMEMIEKVRIIKRNHVPAGIHVERFFLKKPPRSKIVNQNFYPANVDVHFSDVDEVYDVLRSWKNPGSNLYLQKESVDSLLGNTESTGPVWAGRKELILNPKESKTLRSTLVINIGDEIQTNPQIKSTLVSKYDAVALYENPFLESSRWQALQKEILFKLEQIKALATWDEMSNKLIISQGSYYLENLGLHTSFRDFVNASVGVASTMPELAKSILEYCMGLQNSRDSYFPYSWYGPMFIKKESSVRSDLGITLVWGILEYMRANPNWKWFFNSQIPFYPPMSQALPYGATGRSPFDHIKAAFYQLKNVIGTGKNGLPHCKAGDWNDALLSLVDSSGALNSVLDGESPMVGQMAFMVLHDLLTVLQLAPSEESSIDRQRFIEDVRTYLDGLYISLRRVFMENKNQGYPFFPRAILFDAMHRETRVLSKNIDLMGQVWALMVGRNENNQYIEILTPSEREELFQKILETNLSPIGVSTVVIPEGGNSAYFQLQTRPWSVPNQWFAKALADNLKMEEAWRQLWRTSLENHNQIFGQKDSYGNLRNELISGFDGWNPLNGKAWVLPYLPMDEARWNNANYPAMFLWSAHILKEKTLNLEPWRKLREIN